MKKIFRIFIYAIIFFAAGLNAFEITGDTQIVVRGGKSAASANFAAAEIAGYTEKISGIKLLTVQNKSMAPSQIIIGTVDNVKELPVSAAKQLKAADSPDAFAIVCSGNTLIIAGRDQGGELCGTYAFLDGKMGVRWFRAATEKDPYEYVPRKKRIRFDDFIMVREPAFRYRQLTHSGAAGRIPFNGQTVAVRQGFQINPPWNYKRAFQEKFYQERCSMLSVSSGSHGAFYNSVPESLYSKHPEYFALQNGKRVKGKQICISNPNVQHLVQKSIENIYRKIPVNRVAWVFGMLDATTGWCECRSCRDLDGSGAFDYINVSTRFHKTVAKIMAEVYKKYPAAMLEVWAYHTYRTIPENVKYDPRALIYYCTHGRCYGHTLNDPLCRRNVKHWQLIKEWRKISSRMKLYEYANCTPVLYGCMEDIASKDIRLYRKLGLEGWKEEMLFADAQFWPPAKKGVPDYRADRANSNWQWYCVVGKLLWNPDLDPEKILADVESKYYGKAYPAMKKYHEFRRQLWNNSSICLGYPTGDQRRERLLSVPGAKEKLLFLLQKAEKLAGKDPLLTGRLKDDRDWLERYWIKPNEEFRKKETRDRCIPVRVGYINIDGDPGDAEWCRAWHTTDFRYISGLNKGKNAAANKTVCSVLADSGNLYLRVSARGGMPYQSGKNEEYITFFIIPPDSAGIGYAAAVNADGTLRRTLPEKYRNIPAAVSAAVKRNKNGYVMEVKIPLSGIGIPEKGSLWKLHITRNIAGKILSLGGTSPQDKVNFRGFVIGDLLLKNGTFEILTAKGTPVGWIGDKYGIIKQRISHAVKLGKGGYIYQLLAGGELGQDSAARKIKVRFRASGKGVLKVYVVRYNDTRNGKARYGYVRKIISTEEIYKTVLSEKEKAYSCDYTIAPDEWIGLRFVLSSGAEDSFAVLDDVSIARRGERNMNPR